jgi:hypothetical protein
MSAKTTGTNSRDKTRDPDLVKAEIAMQRAAKKAREKARRVGSGVVVEKKGKIVEDRSKASAD